MSIDQTILDDLPDRAFPALMPAFTSRDRLLVLAAFFIGQAVQVNNGMIHPAALAWIGLATISLVASIVPDMSVRFRLLSRLPIGALVAGCIGVQWVELLVWEMRWGTGSIAGVGCMLMMAVGVIIAMVRPAFARWGLVLIVLGFMSAGALTIRSLPRPIIDVWFFQQDSTAALLHGHDPYAVRFRDVYEKDLGFYGPGVSVDGWLTYSFPYPPLMLLLTAPGRLLGDVRWAHLLALSGAAVFISLTAARQRGVLLAAMLLLMPRSLLVIKAAWTEPMVILILSAVVYCACRARGWLWLALGLLLAVKQYTVLAIPLMPLLISPPTRWRDSLYLLLKAGLVAICITAPFVIWNPESFVRSVVLWQFRQPFRTDALSYTAFLAGSFGIQPGIWLGLLCWGMTLVLVWRTAPRNHFGFTAGLSLALLVFFAMNKQAFCNYYFLVIGAICAAAVVSEAAISETTAIVDATSRSAE